MELCCAGVSLSRISLRRIGGLVVLHAQWLFVVFSLTLIPLRTCYVATVFRTLMVVAFLAQSEAFVNGLTSGGLGTLLGSALRGPRYLVFACLPLAFSSTLNTVALDG